MRELIIQFFAEHSRVIIFLHILCAVVLIGCLFVMRFLVAPALNKIKQEEIRLQTYLNVIKYFFYTTTILMITIIIVSVFMNVGFGFKFGDQTTYIIVHVKEGLWTLMACNFILMYFKYLGAKKAMKTNSFIEVHENIVLIVKYLVLGNFILGVICIYLGIIIRGF